MEKVKRRLWPSKSLHDVLVEPQLVLPSQGPSSSTRSFDHLDSSTILHRVSQKGQLPPHSLCFLSNSNSFQDTPKFSTTSSSFLLSSLHLSFLSRSLSPSLSCRLFRLSSFLLFSIVFVCSSFRNVLYRGFGFDKGHRSRRRRDPTNKKRKKRKKKV